MNNYEFFKKYLPIWQCYNKSGNIGAMICRVTQRLDGLKVDYRIDSHGNVFAGDFTAERPCMVAHLDSVHDTPIKKVSYKKGVISSPEGIGGDDKCGIIAALEIIEKHADVNALFCADEEIGCVGARAVDAAMLDKVKYFIEIDRRGNDDIVYRASGVQIASVDFQKALKPYADKYKYSQVWGAVTDVVSLAPKAKSCAINLSAGYYYPHTTQEVVVVSDLRKSISFASAVVSNVKDSFEYKEYTYHGQHRNYHQRRSAEDVVFESLEEIVSWMSTDTTLAWWEVREMQNALQQAFDLGFAECLALFPQSSQEQPS